MRRKRFVLDCLLHNVTVSIGVNVHFAHPVRVWGVGGKITIEDDVHFAFDGGGRWLGPVGIELRTSDAHVHIGPGVWIMRGVRLICFRSIFIAHRATIGDGCILLDSDIHDFTPGSWHKEPRSLPIIIAENAHLAPHVTILKGVRIGSDTIVGNQSVVQRSIPDLSIAAGNPARVLLRHAPVSNATPSAP